MSKQLKNPVDINLVDQKSDRAADLFGFLTLIKTTWMWTKTISRRK